MNWAIIEQVFIMALLAGVGILCRKLKLLDDACTKKLSTVVLNFATPMVILVSSEAVRPRNAEHTAFIVPHSDNKLRHSVYTCSADNTQ